MGIKICYRAGINIRLTSQEKEALGVPHRKERDRRVADLMKGVLLSDEGWSASKLDAIKWLEHLEAIVDSVACAHKHVLRLFCGAKVFELGYKNLGYAK